MARPQLVAVARPAEDPDAIGVDPLDLAVKFCRDRDELARDGTAILESRHADLTRRNPERPRDVPR